MFQFDHEDIRGWRWFASLVIQRHNSLELLIEGRRETRNVGSSWLMIAVESGAMAEPPVPREHCFPPNVVRNRPNYDGDMAAIERLVPELVELFGFVKGIL